MKTYTYFISPLIHSLKYYAEYQSILPPLPYSYAEFMRDLVQLNTCYSLEEPNLDFVNACFDKFKDEEIVFQKDNMYIKYECVHNKQIMNEYEGWWLTLYDLIEGCPFQWQLNPEIEFNKIEEINYFAEEYLQVKEEIISLGWFENLYKDLKLLNLKLLAREAKKEGIHD